MSHFNEHKFRIVAKHLYLKSVSVFYDFFCKMHQIQKSTLVLHFSIFFRIKKQKMIRHDVCAIITLQIIKLWRFSELKSKLVFPHSVLIA